MSIYLMTWWIVLVHYVLMSPNSKAGKSKVKESMTGKGLYIVFYCGKGEKDKVDA